MENQRTSGDIRNRAENLVETSRHMPKKRIFLVDNDLNTIYILALMLKLNDFEVVPVTDSEAALASFGRDQFDLLLLEVRMPGIGGFELYQKIRQVDANVKVCFMTNHPAAYMQEFTKSFPDLDCKNLVEKPIAAAELLKLVEGYFER